MYASVIYTTTSSDNGLSPDRCQAIIWTNAGILLIGPLGTNFSEILIRIQTFSFRKMHLKMSSAKWPPFCLGLNLLMPRNQKCDQPLPAPNMTQSTDSNLTFYYYYWMMTDCHHSSPTHIYHEIWPMVIFYDGPFGNFFLSLTVFSYNGDNVSPAYYTCHLGQRTV